MGTLCSLIPPAPLAAAGATFGKVSALLPTDDEKEDEGEIPIATMGATPGGEKPPLTADDGEKLKEEERREGVATGGAEGN